METRTHYASSVSPEAVFCTMPYDQLCENHKNTFKIYPNPAKGCITIEGTGIMTVTNALGQTILTKEIKGKEGGTAARVVFREKGWRNAENRGGIIFARRIRRILGSAKRRQGYIQ